MIIMALGNNLVFTGQNAPLYGNPEIDTGKYVDYNVVSSIYLNNYEIKLRK